LPFSDFIDISDDDLTLSDLEKLDRQAEKTEKKLERLKKKAGPVLPKNRITPQTGQGPLANLPVGTRDKEAEKLQRKIEKRFERLQKKVNKDFVKNFGKDKQGIAKQIFGNNIGQTLFSVGKNPTQFIQNTVLGLAAFSGGAFVLQIANSVIKEIQRLDKFFKIFIDRIDDRVDQLRNKQQQAEIAAGLTQVIITTSSGSIEARDAYNTFNEFNNNRGKLEDDYSIRNTTGYE